MKHKFFPIICMVVLFGCTTEKTPEPITEVGWFTPYTLQPEFISGQVESLEWKTYWVTEQDGEYVQGDPITQEERDSLGWSYDFIAYFDSMGLVKKAVYFLDEGEVEGHWKTDVEDGKYVNAMWTSQDTLRSITRYFYDEAGKLIKMENWRPEVDTLNWSFEFKTNDEGLWIWAQGYDSKGEPTSEFTMEYDETGRVTARDVKNADGDVTFWSKKQYDADGMLVTQEYLKKDSTVASVEMKYDDFDEKGNWLKIYYFIDSKLDGMEVRTIKYY